MTRQRNTRRWGNSDVIILNPQDKHDLNIEIGVDKVDIEDIVIVKKKREENVKKS